MLRKIDNQYDLVLLAKGRTVQLNAGAPMLVEEDNDANNYLIKEIGDGKIDVKKSKLAQLKIKKRARRVRGARGN